MTKARMTTVSEEAERSDFAKEAALHFAAHPEHWSYSRDELAPSVLLALRWGLGNDCVLVLKVHDFDELVIYQQIIVRGAQPAPVTRSEFTEQAIALLRRHSYDEAADVLERAPAG